MSSKYTSEPHITSLHELEFNKQNSGWDINDVADNGCENKITLLHSEVIPFVKALIDAYNKAEETLFVLTQDKPPLYY